MIILGKSPCLALNEDAGSLSQKESLLFPKSPRKLTRKLKKKVSCCFDDKVQGLSFDKWSFIMDSGMQITSLLLPWTLTATSSLAQTHCLLISS